MASERVQPAKKRLSHKWKFAIGTTSRIPFKPGYHYFMLDIDGELPFRFWKDIIRLAPAAVIDRTRRGYHVYTNHIVSSAQFIKLASGVADPVWLKIGTERGYWFLADRTRALHFDWTVERMVIYGA